MKEAALDGAALEDPALRRLELVDPRREQRVDRGRDGDVPAAGILDERDHLLDEERVALGRVADPLLQTGGERAVAEEPLQQLFRLVRVERLEQERRRVQLAAAPAGPLVEQLRPRQAEQEEGNLAREVGHVLEEVEERRLTPVMSSKTAKTGRVAATASSNLRKAQGISSLEVLASVAPSNHSTVATAAGSRSSSDGGGSCFSTSTTGQ